MLQLARGVDEDHDEEDDLEEYYRDEDSEMRRKRRNSKRRRRKEEEMAFAAHQEEEAKSLLLHKADSEESKGKKGEIGFHFYVWKKYCWLIWRRDVLPTYTRSLLMLSVIIASSIHAASQSAISLELARLWC